MLGNPQFAPLSQTIVDLILACLKKNPAGRPTADELVERCGKLYYPTMDRQFGVVREIKFDSWGFIKVGGQDVFFNHDSVYGEKPKVGDYVLLSKFVGGGAPRAHPVLKLRK